MYRFQVFAGQMGGNRPQYYGQQIRPHCSGFLLGRNFIEPLLSLFLKAGKQKHQSQRRN